jgi:hypothetical protein
MHDADANDVRPINLIVTDANHSPLFLTRPTKIVILLVLRKQQEPKNCDLASNKSQKKGATFNTLLDRLEYKSAGLVL